jgi:FKBP-type peptidyl-prolyl cis-trans isomerase
MNSSIRGPKFALKQGKDFARRSGYTKRAVPLTPEQKTARQAEFKRRIAAMKERFAAARKNAVKQINAVQEKAANQINAVQEKAANQINAAQQNAAKEIKNVKNNISAAVTQINAPKNLPSNLYQSGGRRGRGKTIKQRGRKGRGASRRR